MIVEYLNQENKLKRQKNTVRGDVTYTSPAFYAMVVAVKKASHLDSKVYGYDRYALTLSLIQTRKATVIRRGCQLKSALVSFEFSPFETGLQLKPPR